MIFVSEAYEAAHRPTEADIEDLIDADVYEALAREAYGKELKGKSLSVNAKIPRIVKRLEKGFEEVDLKFHKTMAAGLFYRRMTADPHIVMTDASAKLFATLFALIKERLEAIARLHTKHLLPIAIFFQFVIAGNRQAIRMGDIAIPTYKFERFVYLALV